mgnify:CR=1 FL=1
MDSDVKINGTVFSQGMEANTCIIGALFLAFGTEPLVGGGDGVPIDLDKFLVLDDTGIFSNMPEAYAVNLAMGEP